MSSASGEQGDRTPDALRDGVRAGIVEKLQEESSAADRLMRRLAAAGAAGVAAAVALTLLFAGERSSHAAHLAACGAVWAGLLVECFAFVLLRVQTPRIPARQAAGVALTGVALAALVMAICPEPHIWSWWRTTAVGRGSEGWGGGLGSALCFGLCTSLAVAVGASLVVALRGVRIPHVPLPALLLAVLLAPAAILQSEDLTLNTFVAWLIGTAVGSYGGLALGIGIARLARTPYHSR